MKVGVPLNVLGTLTFSIFYIQSLSLYIISIYIKQAAAAPVYEKLSINLEVLNNYNVVIWISDISFELNI